MKQHYDAIVLGAGNVGLIQALALAQAGFHIALVDARPLPDAASPVGDPRVSAIAQSSLRIFQQLGLLEALFKRPICAYDRMQVWDDATGAGVSFAAAEMGAKQLGHIIPNTDLAAVCRQALLQDERVQLCFGELASAVALTTAHASLTLRSGQHLQAPVIIGADGARSWLRAQLDMACRERPYDQTAIVATVETAQPHGGCARQVFLDTGPAALLPLAAPRQTALVWSVDNAVFDRLIHSDDAEFMTRLSAAIGHHLGGVITISQRHHFPLVARHARAYVQPRVALVGDAAHTLHPLAGLGANLGFLDAACLTAVLSSARHKRRDMGALDTLVRYQRWRYEANQTALWMMRALRNIFAQQTQPLSMARRLGLSAVDQSLSIKRYLMQHAFGLKGVLPPLARYQVDRMC